MFLIIGTWYVINILTQLLVPSVSQHVMVSFMRLANVTPSDVAQYHLGSSHGIGSPTSCAVVCTTEYPCQSFMYNTDNLTCNTYTVRNVEHLASGSTTPPWKFYTMKVPVIQIYCPFDVSATWKYNTYTNMCYGFVNRSVNWDTAQSECMAMGAALTSIHSSQEQTFIEVHTSITVGIVTWCGISVIWCVAGIYMSSLKAWRKRQEVFLETTAPSRMWIGMYGTDQLDWIDGSALDYENWIPGEEPNNNNTHCIEMMSDAPYNGQWNDHSCNRLHPYMCKRISIA